MNTAIYQPFKHFDFRNEKCFLSGAPFPEQSRVLPKWLMVMAGLTGNEQIKLLDESIRSYQSLTVPLAKEIEEKFTEPLEAQVEAAFAAGYQGVSTLTEKQLFNWIGKLMYGFLYVEMQGAIRLNQLSANGMNMSQGLMHKFGNLHTMLQNIHRTVVFEDFAPWSIVVVPLACSTTAFSFRDEINTLSFSLKFKDFGIIACLQDNGTNKRYHEEILESIAGQPLNEQQFEELAARFFYSAYLFNRLPEYTILTVEDVIYIDAMPLKGSQQKSLFDAWTHKTYAQVLENFWKPWGHTLFEILKDPAAPLSYFDKPYLPAT
jgi:hypothetical protein